jgi:hypothetical protein
VSRRHVLSALILLLLLTTIPTLGLVPGTQMSPKETGRTIRLAPQADEPQFQRPVEASKVYTSRDTWHAELAQSASGNTVAEITTADGTGEVEAVRLLSSTDSPDLSEREAVKLALANPEVREELSERGSYSTDAEYADGTWTVRFYVEEKGPGGGKLVDDGRKEVARVGVDDETWALDYVWTGDQIVWKQARGEMGSYGKQANYWYVWGPMALAFALVFLRNDKLFSLRNLDVAALLGFLVSHHFYRQGAVFEAVLLWHLPLIYLFVRTLLMGFGLGERVHKTTNFPTWVLIGLSGLAAGLVLYLNLDSRVIDVGYAGVVGADRILEGTLPYGNMPEDVPNGDTYGPLNYLFYVPFVVMFGFSGEWDFLPAAHALTAFAFVAGALALLFAGWRFSGPKGGAALLFAWCVFPYTLYSTNNNTNDILVAAVCAVAIAIAASPLGRGATIAAAFAIKLYPFILVPLWMLHDGVRRRRPIVDFILGGLGIIVLSFWVLLLDGQPVESARLFYERTFGVQSARATPWNIFTQVPALGFLQQPLLAVALLLAFVAAVWPKKRTVRRLAAFSATLVIGLQLAGDYWFYPYVTWFTPFVFLALLLDTNEKTALDGEVAQQSALGDRERTEQ